MACGGELPELTEARLKVKAMRSFVRNLDVALARAEEALENNRKCKCQSTPQPTEAQGQHERHHLTAA